MTAELMTLQVRSRRGWRAWLAKHHTSSHGVWLVFYKAHAGKKSIRYEDTVREALCFGWVDSLIKRLDADRYAIKVTPRRPTSKCPIPIGSGGRRSRRPACSPRPVSRRHQPTMPTRRNQGPPATGLHRQGAEDKIQSVGVLSGAGAHRPTEFRRLDSPG
jgi:hypothetical protein